MTYLIFQGGSSLVKEISKEKAEMLYNDYSKYVYRVSLFLTKSKTLAEDITHETFLRIFQKYGTYDCEKPVKPWIYRITINVTRNMLRKVKRLGVFDELQRIEGSDYIDDIILKDEEARLIMSKVNELSPKSREVIVLHFYVGLKLNEISEALDIPLGTCKSRLNSALNALRKQLPKEMFYTVCEEGSICETRL
jgi:RNA polymerase sigma-70 factor (ECF subfamily)